MMVFFCEVLSPTHLRERRPNWSGRECVTDVVVHSEEPRPVDDRLSIVDWHLIKKIHVHVDAVWNEVENVIRNRVWKASQCPGSVVERIATACEPTQIDCVYFSNYLL